MTMRKAAAKAKTDEELAREEVARLLGVAPPARAAKGIFATLSTLPGKVINPVDLVESVGDRFVIAGASSPMDAIGFLLSSDLGKVLEAAYGKCDAMVPGKYRRARAFVFETPKFHVWCEAEPGDRGSSWMLARRDAMPASPAGHYGYARMGSDPELAKEIGDFMEALMVGAALRHPETMSQLSETIPAVRRLFDGLAAHAEAAEISAWAAAPGEDASAPPRARRKL